MTEGMRPSTDEPLPGLADPAPQATALELQVDRSLRYMVAHELVDERHAGVMELTRTLAASIRPGEKAYGVAQCAAQLLAAFQVLVPEQEGGSDGWSELRAYLAGVDAAGGTAPVRDPS